MVQHSCPPRRALGMDSRARTLQFRLESSSPSLGRTESAVLALLYREARSPRSQAGELGSSRVSAVQPN